MKTIKNLLTVNNNIRISWKKNYEPYGHSSNQLKCKVCPIRLHYSTTLFTKLLFMLKMKLYTNCRNLLRFRSLFS